ncbi:integrin beta-1-binding protein 1-like [Glandiceps talaboti]
MSTCCCALMFKGNKTKKRDHNGSTDAIVVRDGSFRSSHESELGSDHKNLKKNKMAKKDVLVVERHNEPRTYYPAPTRPLSASIEESDTSSISGRGILETTLEFQVQVVGILNSIQGLDHSHEDHIDLINTLDQARHNKHISFDVQREDHVILTLSKYGLKVTELFPPSPKVVRNRYPLSDIIRTVHFQDEHSRCLLAVKIGQVEEDVYDCLVFQCRNKEQADDICRRLMQIFDAICEIEVLESDPPLKYRTL